MIISVSSRVWGSGTLPVFGRSAAQQRQRRRRHEATSTHRGSSRNRAPRRRHRRVAHQPGPGRDAAQDPAPRNTQPLASMTLSYIVPAWSSAFRPAGAVPAVRQAAPNGGSSAAVSADGEDLLDGFEDAIPGRRAQTDFARLGDAVAATQVGRIAAIPAPTMAVALRAPVRRQRWFRCASVTPTPGAGLQHAGRSRGEMAERQRLALRNIVNDGSLIYDHQRVARLLE
jgi:hypothetical protein